MITKTKNNPFLNGGIDIPDLIKKYIETFNSSPERDMMTEGQNYYVSENTRIRARKMWTYSEEILNGIDGAELHIPVLMEDPYKANNKLASGFFKTLVDQKLEYILGNEPTLKTLDETDIMSEQLKVTMSKKFNSNVKKAAKDAIKKSIGWIHVYLDPMGRFRTMRIIPEQMIPIYNAEDTDELISVIRHYSVMARDKDGAAVEVIRAEVWDDKQVTYYQQIEKNGDYALCNEEQVGLNPQYHFTTNKKYGETIKETTGQSWGAVPFIPIRNNDEHLYDLKPVKDFIDAYDLVDSDFMNNLEDFQDVVWILKNYEGQNIEKFKNDLKKFKALNVGEDGDAKPQTIEIPYLARAEALKGIRNDIYDFGQGFDPDEATGATATATFIEALYVKLSLKGKGFISELNNFFDTLLLFVNRYWEIKGMQTVDIENVEVVYNLTLISNETAELKTNAEQQGNVSEKTRLSHHPWVTDVEEETAQMEEEAAANAVTIPDDPDTDPNTDPENDPNNDPEG